MKMNMNEGDKLEYLALYRKYRPAAIDEVVGQVEIKKILANSIKNGTISHAYLFSGPRGTGKTTMAKIMAKMVNCENLNDNNPCGECNSCINIFNNNDVIEIDAASNNGVDEIRDLREKVNLVPSVCKYKVYIIDEVHMLTTQAFNALLKTLEEPPKHVIFILATTEYHKIPLTITSRCQKFQFNKIEIDDIVLRLKKIAELENINIDDDALYEIAKISDGGMRDSINFLDQLRSFSLNKITINDVYDVCGNISSNEIANMLINIKKNDAESIVTFFENMNANGKNYSKFFEDMMMFLKDIILYKKDVTSKYIKSNIENITSVSSVYEISELFYIIDVINNLMDKLKSVSRQSIVVISNFLLIMSKLNGEMLVDKEKKEVNEKIKLENDNTNYELAFEFTSVDKDKKCEVSIEIEQDKKQDTYDKYLINKENIINNTFALADKMLKADLQGKWSLVSDYLTDKKYSSVSGFLVDSNIEVAGNGYILFTGNYDAIVDNVYNNYLLCSELINKILEDKFNFVFITIDEWNKKKDEYIANIKAGKKYNLVELVKIDENKDNKKEEKNKKEPTIVDRLFDIVGEDSIEFK